MRNFPLIITIVGTAGSVFLLYFGFRGWKRFKLITGTVTSRISGVLGGLVEVNGKVVSMKEQLLESPWSGIPCVYYHFKVQEQRHRSSGGGRTNTYWATVVDDKEYAKCGVDDDTGTIVVDLEKADLVLDRDAHARSGLFSTAPPELEEALNSRYGRSSKGFLFNRNMRFAETILEVGDEIYVLGDVTVTGGGEWRITKREHPLIVSDKGERGATRRFLWQAILSWVGAVVVAVVVCYFLRGTGVL
ncbi:GIDE domain-containing protein [Gemmatimonadota bacterium]